MDNWTSVTSIEQLQDIDTLSQTELVLIFKHSTRCSISSIAKHRLSTLSDNTTSIKGYYLDLIAFRDIYNEISTRYQIIHKSPQVILIRNGNCINHCSHLDIDLDNVLSQV